MRKSNSPRPLTVHHSLPAMLKIPAEINERILTMSDPTAIAAMAQSCSFFRNLINRPLDQHLWRSLFLARFDDPRTTFVFYGGDGNNYPWSTELKRRIRSQTLLTRRNGFDSLSSDEQRLVLQTLTDALCRAPPPYTLMASSQDIEWIKWLIGTARIFKASSCAETQELLAQLHVYYGITREEKMMPAAYHRRTVSRSWVYDLRKYNEGNEWGPYLKGGRVSWVHIDHIINVISMNLEDIVELWEEMRPPIGLEATRPYSAPAVDHRMKDWAGVGGKWFRFVCFMDYRDLFTYNFSTPSDSETEPLSTAIFEDEDFQEAIRLIELNLRVVGMFPSPSHPQHPTIKFQGASKGAQGNEARVEGTVHMTPDHQVRWQFVSVYDGETQWSSEGIQLGGVASAMGVVGTWTGAFHSERDPVGPFWLWKVKESE